MALFFTETFPLDVSVSDEDFKAFYTIDRTLYTRLVFNLGRDPAESMQVIGFYLWLENARHVRHMVARTLTLPDTLVNSLADEVVLCLECIESDEFNFPPNAEDVIPLLHCTSNGLTLQFFHDNRISIIRNVTKNVNEVCARAFDDISRMHSRNSVDPNSNSGKNKGAFLGGEGSSSGASGYIGTLNTTNVNLGMNPNVVGGMQHWQQQMQVQMTQQLQQNQQYPLYPLSNYDPVWRPPSLPSFGHYNLGQTWPNLGSTNNMNMTQNVMVQPNMNMRPPNLTNPNIKNPKIDTNTNASVSSSSSNYVGSGGGPMSILWESLGPYDLAGQRQMLNNEYINIGEIMCKLQINDTDEKGQVVGTDDEDQVAVDDRTIFLTFSKGYPISKVEVIEFFTRTFGDCIEAIYMQEVLDEEQQPLFARLLVYDRITLDFILRGKAKAKFTINGKHMWARKYIRSKKPLSPPRTATRSPSGPPPPTTSNSSTTATTGSLAVSLTSYFP